MKDFLKPVTLAGFFTTAVVALPNAAQDYIDVEAEREAAERAAVGYTPPDTGTRNARRLYRVWGDTLRRSNRYGCADHDESRCIASQSQRGLPCCAVAAVAGGGQATQRGS